MKSGCMDRSQTTPSCATSWLPVRVIVPGSFQASTSSGQSQISCFPFSLLFTWWEKQLQCEPDFWSAVLGKPSITLGFCRVVAQSSILSVAILHGSRQVSLRHDQVDPLWKERIGSWASPERKLHPMYQLAKRNTAKKSGITGNTWRKIKAGGQWHLKPELPCTEDGNLLDWSWQLISIFQQTACGATSPCIEDDQIAVGCRILSDLPGQFSSSGTWKIIAMREWELRNVIGLGPFLRASWHHEEWVHG